MEAAQTKVGEAVNKMLSDIDKAQLSKIQGDSFRCSANCCESSGSMEDRQECIANCMTPMARAQDMIVQELNNFQSRIERCVMDCGDKIRDKTGGDSSKINQHKAGYESCIATCAETNIKLLPNVSKTILSKLKQ